MMHYSKIFAVLILPIFAMLSCNKNGNISPIDPQTPIEGSKDVAVWMTKANEQMLLEKQSSYLSYVSSPNYYETIDVNPTKTFQTVDGFGYTLTGGSAFLINRMEITKQQKLLDEFFSCAENGICVSYLRISMGASDLDDQVFSYNDILPTNEDLSLSKFSLSKDTIHLIPILKKILAINPEIKIMATPWSAPLWMKDNKQSVGGSLLQKYYGVYADYFVAYLKAMKNQGININAVTLQNEPQHGGNNPSMVMSSAEQADFVANHLGPKFKKENINTKIIVWDHNCDNPSYPIDVLKNAEANPFIDGSAFHLYSGNIDALSQVHQAFPDKNVYFTEQWTGAKGNFAGDFKWHIKNVIIGSMKNWSKTALEWNLANDVTFGPHTPGGCTECKGAVTITGNTYSKNVAYYIIGQVSKFVPAGSKVIETSNLASIPNVAFITPNEKVILITLNESEDTKIFNIGFGGKKAIATLPANTAGTYILN
ncbi:MAG TPA: glycoside hydrolase family 30 beta sandwich domain-containing protein [Saprospiraceae bacterium]|nr:glycoside hydrolase family 30 beta sandwich domain-containing protein [Saprospiraceae bacterium]HPN68830.1 glycoside hydrolase family 30 beta sandwich domain-containing protein [Saprospiraceae bacterium]